jgi:hypothetical protein
VIFTEDYKLGSIEVSMQMTSRQLSDCSTKLRLSNRDSHESRSTPESKMRREPANPDANQKEASKSIPTIPKIQLSFALSLWTKPNPRAL